MSSEAGRSDTASFSLPWASVMEEEAQATKGVRPRHTLSRIRPEPAMPTPSDPHTLARWRLVLGKAAEGHGIDCGGDERAERIEGLVGFLFEGGGEGEGTTGGAGGGNAAAGSKSSRKRIGTRGGSRLTVPAGVDAVNELFPRQSKEVMQRELVRRRGIAELMEKPELLEKIEPNLELVKTLLTHRELMNPKTRGLARKIIDRVVEELKRKMQLQVEQ